MEEKENIGTKIKEARQAAGITQAELADRIGSATITIRQYETGKRTPRLEQIRRIALELNTTVSDLVGPDFWAGITKEDAEDAWMPTNDRKLLRKFHALTSEGQKKLVDRADELLEIPKYRCQVKEDSEATHGNDSEENE